MASSSELRRYIEDGDVQGAWTYWACVAPHLPQAKSHAEAEATLHYARTSMVSMPFRKRAYSHAWLSERAMPSGLPDWLRPRAERLYPRVVEGVGIAVKGSGHKRALALALRTAMEQAVMECYADGKTEPEFIRARLREARAKVMK
jgi:hypothetical protein